jgi:hypothetical protein
MRHRLSHLAFSVLAGLSFQAYAFHPLVTDDTGTQGTGGNQLEVGMDYVDENPGHARALGITYTRGLTDTLDAFVGAAYQTSSPRGWGNVGVGLKWRFFEDEASKFSLALKPDQSSCVFRCRNATSKAAAAGMATRMPTKPNNWPKAISAKMTATGCRPTRSPTSQGVTAMPSSNWPTTNTPQIGSSDRQRCRTAKSRPACPAAPRPRRPDTARTPDAADQTHRQCVVQPAIHNATL